MESFARPGKFNNQENCHVETARSDAKLANARCFGQAKQKHLKQRASPD